MDTPSTLSDRQLDNLLCLLDDPDEAVRVKSLEALEEGEHPDLVDHALRMSYDVHPLARRATAGVLGRLCLTAKSESSRSHIAAACSACLKKLLADSMGSVRVSALRGLEQAGEAGLRDHALAGTSDSSWQVRATAVQVLGRIGDERDIDRALSCSLDEKADVRERARPALGRLCRRHGVTPSLVTSLIQRLDCDDRDATEDFLAIIAESAPRMFDVAVSSVVASSSWKTRVAAARSIAQHSEHLGDNAVALLQTMLGEDSDEDVRREALAGLQKLIPNEVAELAAAHLGDSNWKVRQKAIECLKNISDSALVDRLVPRARDEDADVRKAAIELLAEYDDERTLSELISSLNDTNEDVAATARELLEEKKGPLPVLRHRPAGIWKHFVEQVNEVLMWGVYTGQELLGRPVLIDQYRQGIGRTRNKAHTKVVKLEISDTPVTSGHRWGTDIMRGIILHEIGHHLHDIGVRGHKTMSGIARSEGLSEIFEILLDERLERRLRSRRDDWGVYLDRLASYAFAQDTERVPLESYAALVGMEPDEVAKGLEGRLLPGRLLPASSTDGKRLVSLDILDQLSLPGLLSKLSLFLVFLRAGFSPTLCPDGDVVVALSLVPSNLKDQPHRGVLETAREIGDIIGRQADHKHGHERLRRKLSKHGGALNGLRRSLDRLASTKQVPDWMSPKSADRGAAGIRSNPEMEEEMRAAASSPRSARSRSCRPGHAPIEEPGGQAFNNDPGREFELLTRETRTAFDQPKHCELVGSIRRHIRSLRRFLERLGTTTVEDYASRRGRRLDLGRVARAVYTSQPNFLVHSQQVVAPDAYLGVLIDRSGSMYGPKIERARAFGTLVAESAKGLRGIVGHVNAFDDDTFVWLGDFQRHTTATLTSRGGNNDSGALTKAAELALKSGKKNKLLIMISDGSPTECTFESLEHLVKRLGREEGIVCAQVAVEPLRAIAFPHYVDLSQYTLDESVARFGRKLMELTNHWR